MPPRPERTMKIEKVIDALYKYVEDKLFPTMVNWQKVTARTFMLRIKKKPEIIAKAVPILNIFEYVDDKQDIDIDGFIEDLAEAVKAEGSFELSIPLLGLKYKFLPSDVEDLCRYLKNS